MLVELTIRNFAVIKDTRIEFGPGMNALTGETGAGKSIVLDALGAVLGERTSPAVIRAGEDRAYIEAIFDLSAIDDRDQIDRVLAELGIEQEPGEPLILARDITPSRSTARINGRAVTASGLTAVGELLVDIHGQSDHLSLLRPAAQLDMLDSYAETWPLRRQVARVHAEWRELQRRIQAFDLEARERAQRIDLLQIQLEEIEGIAPQPGELEELEGERQRLTHAERLMELAETARAALEGESSLDTLDAGALDRLRASEAAIADMARLDTSTERYLNDLREALFTLDELSSDLRDYREMIQADPERLEVVNERLQGIRGLLRKYGSTIEEILAYADDIRGQLEELQRTGGDIEQLRTDEDRLRKELTELSLELSRKRAAAGDELARQVEETIAELNMGAARFRVALGRRESRDGLEIDGLRVAVDETGIDRVTFMLAANPGSEPQPLARVASGGETARIMLALKSILSAADSTPTLVFDEIDVGVGGRSGQIVGEKLWQLTDDHQVIVISHLPQVAAFADRHVAMVKGQVDGQTITRAEHLDELASVDEIATMFDGKPVSPESRANAQALLRRVNAWKAEHARASGARRAG